MSNRVTEDAGDTLHDTPSASKSEGESHGASSKLTARAFELTNIERSRAGLPPLRLESRLAAAAQAHSQNMALKDFFSHTGEGGDTPWDRIQATGYQYSRAAENLYGGASTAEQAVQGWMQSPGHRANILNPDLQEIGIGHYFLASDTGSVNYKHYWTQVFATPADASQAGADPAREVSAGRG